MPGQPFFKMTGSGNDFVFVDGRASPVEAWPAERIRAACDRRTGIGGDGVVVLAPEGPDTARMTYFNADGSRAGMCGNAALCSTRLAALLGLAPPTGMQLLTDTGLLETRCVGPGWAAELLLPGFELPADLPVPLLPGERWAVLTTVGVPHLVVLVDEIQSIDVDGRGGALRRDASAGPQGVNANFVARTPKDPEASWRLRTFERGVEGETLACGTGTVAAAFALAARGLDQLPVRIRSWGGNVFSVAGEIEDGRAVRPWLCGEGRLVFAGEWFEESGALSVV